MLTFIFVMFCIFPALAGFYVYKTINKIFLPFIYAAWLAVLVEIVARCAYLSKSKIVFSLDYNLFMVINFALYLWLFFNLKLLNKKTAISIFIIAIALKLFELYNVNAWKVLRSTSIFECAIIVFYCTKALSNILLFNSEKLIKSTLFIIIISILVLNLFDILNTLLGWVIPISSSITVTTTIIFNIINTLYYLAITYALLCTVQNKK